MLNYTADFETITKAPTRVWAWGVCDIKNPSNFIHGNSIDTFMEFCSGKGNHKLWFHNLKFDGMFIMYWLYRNKFKQVYDKRELKSKTFSTLISDMGQWYSIEIIFEKKGHKTNKVTIYDSLKILNFSVSNIAKDFNLEIQKLSIGQYNPIGIKRIKSYEKIKIETKFTFKEYLKIKKKYVHKNLKNIKRMELGYKGYRELGHKLTDTELCYLRNDCEIMARALNFMFDQGMDKMTIGSDALHEYKKVIGEKQFSICFPELSKSIDSFIRNSYKGGWSYLARRYRGKTIADGRVYDNNSLYPSRMYDCPMPFGKPVFYKGKYKDDKLYPLYVQRIICQFKLKKDHLPSIQLKHSLSFKSTEYLESSVGNDGIDREQCLTLTSVDLKLFFEQYDVYNIQWIDGYKFKSSTQMFKKYIDKWISIKIQSKKEHNGAMTKTAKLMLNSLYGKFGLNPKVRSKYTFYDKEKDLVHFRYGEYEERESIYVPVACFVTAYGRYLTISSAQKVYNRFVYADTDSLHLEGLEIPTILDIDEYNLGWWKNEFIFEKGEYLRQKSYMEYGYEPDNPDEKFTKITCAGMPSRCYKNVTFENFKVGSKFEGKLQHTNVQGGVILQEKLFTIKAL